MSAFQWLALAVLVCMRAGEGSAAFPPTGAVWKAARGSWDLPVLTADNSTWEGSAVQEPQVVYQAANKSLRMWYRGGGWGRPSGVGVADSFDGGVTWSKYSGNPVWSGGDAHCAGQPWVYKESDQQYWLFASTNHPPRVCVASSTDGTTWVNASDLGSSAVSLPPSGTLFGNRAVWKETGPGGDAWKMLQECGTTRGVWEIFLYEGSSPTSWKVGNGGEPLTQLQRHPGSMYGGCHIATVDGVYMPRDPSSGLYNIWYHAGARGNLPTDIYHATSPDLMNWTVAPAGPVVTHQGGGSFAFDQVADPSPLTVGLRAYLAYDGDNNGCHGCSHAAIGMAVGSAVP